MNPKYHIIEALHTGGHALRIRFADGATIHFDLGPWFTNSKRNPYGNL